MVFILKTYDPDKHQNQDYKFYIQSKGNNAGQPLLKPKRNCWIVITDIPLAYEICTVLWISKIYENSIIGSVIPFIRVNDYLKITLPYLTSHSEYSNTIEQGLISICNIDQLIDTTLSKLKLFKELKIVTAYKLLNQIEKHHL
jgi:hypothetical protein